MPMKDKSILHYILGLLTGLLFIPIIEEIIDIVQAWVQALLITPSKIVLQGNKELSELQDNEEEIQTQCIGFQIPSSNDYEDDYDE